MPDKSKAGRKPGATEPLVADLIKAIDQIAPFANAEDWDNVGLLAGRPEWSARRVLVAIDLTDAAAQEALSKRVDALLVYHPPIFKGLRSITPDAEGPTGRLADLLAERISIIATHTAFDSAEGGVNDILLDLFEPVARRPLEIIDCDCRDYKLAVFVPESEADALRQALAAAGAGLIGHYSECSFELSGRGTFRGDETSNPRVGRKQAFETVDETRLEMIVPRRSVGEAVRALYAAHPYEEPAFDLYPTRWIAGRGRVGLGRVGVLRKPTRGAELVKRLAAGVDMSIATTVGDLKRRFKSVTAGAGAFGASRFRDPDSLAVTGEFKHHDALDLLRRGVTSVCLGHYASEALVLDVLCRKIRKALKGVSITKARADRSPFQPVRA